MNDNINNTNKIFEALKKLEQEQRKYGSGNENKASQQRQAKLRAFF